MALRKQIVEMPAMDGLQQKTSSQRLPPGTSAQAINLQKNKQGRLEKRLGHAPINMVDPYGSGYVPTTGLGLGVWNGGTVDNLVIAGRGAVPNTTTVSAAIQSYSDDLNGPILRGLLPELRVTVDSPVAGSPGAVTNPVTAVSGEYVLSVWIEAASPLPAIPLPPNGQLIWQLSQISNGQVIAGPALVDQTTVGQTVQFVRLDVVGTTFVVTYTRGGDSNIYARIAALSTLTAGGTWSNAPSSSATAIVSNNVSTNAAFTMRSANDGTHFVVAYESGTGNPGDRGATATAIIVQSFTANTLALVNTWTVESTTAFATGYGIRVNGSHVVVCYSRADTGGVYSYQVYAAVGAYPALTQVNTPTTIYTPTTTIASNAPESAPFFLDVSSCGTTNGHENYVCSHSPAGAVWNAAMVPAVAAKAAGVGATATCNIKGSVGSNTLTSGGEYQNTRNGSNSVIATVTDATGQQGPMWTLQGFSSPGLQIYDQPNNTYISQMDPVLSASPTTGTTASLVFNASLGTVMGTGMSGIVTAQGGFPITISGGTTAHPGTFVITMVGQSLTGTVTVTNGSTSITFSTNQSMTAGQTVMFSKQPGAIYQIAANTTSSTSATLTAAYTGTGGAGGTTSVMGVSGDTVLYNDPSGATDTGGAVHWSVPSQYTGPNNLVYPIKCTFSGGVGVVTQATATVQLSGGIYQSGFTLTNGGEGFPPSTSTIPIVFTSVDGNGSGATATAQSDSNGHITGWTASASGSGYSKPPTMAIGQYTTPTQAVTPLTQETQCRLIGFTSTDNLHPENNARILNNMFFVNTTPNGAVHRYNPTDGFGYCCGDDTGPGASYGSHALSCITPGVTLASGGLEANGKVYYLGWVPSNTQGSFIILAFDLAQNPIVNGSGTITGNGWPMRPVGLLQTRSALADPGGGLQDIAQSGQTIFAGTPSMAPNMWTGGSYWYLGTDNYATAYVSYVSSSTGERLSLVTGSIQTLPRQSPQMAKWGTLTSISGPIQTIFDGHSVFEQGFLWSPDSVVAIATTSAGSPGAGLDFTSVTDSYSWIFTWEHFDDQGNLHISARSLPVTITGQNLVDGGFVTSGQLTAGISFSFTFIVPTLGATLRMFPEASSGSLSAPYGNDLRAYCATPTAPVSLGFYRAQKNQQVYYRIYDRAFNGIDPGGASFTLPSLVANNFISSYPNTGNPADNVVGVVKVTDGLNDSVITRVNQDNVLPFPLLYTDGTSGNPGSLDGFCPPASDITCRHKERLFTVDGNLVMFTKQRGEQIGPGYNTAVNSVYVGGDDAITGLASMDDKLIIFKTNQIYYISGDGPADDGSGSNFSDPQMIPTDAGCIMPNSVVSTPEGVYFMSDAGLRVVTRSLGVEYVGGPVEDELGAYPVVTGAVLYPGNNKVLFLANQSDYATGNNYLTGEVLVRDYVLDAWTTTQYENAALGFISTAVAYASGGFGLGTWSASPGPAWHVLSANGQVLRERNPADAKAYYDGSFPYAYVQSTWLSAPVKMQDLARFRAWDFVVWGSSKDPHGLIVSTAIDCGTPGLSKTYSWAVIAPGGVTPLPLTQIRSYDGRMGEAFQVQVQDISDASSSTGQGFQVLGLSVTTGAYEGQYKLPPGSTK